MCIYAAVCQYLHSRELITAHSAGLTLSTIFQLIIHRLQILVFKRIHHIATCTSSKSSFHATQCPRYHHYMYIHVHVPYSQISRPDKGINVQYQVLLSYMYMYM